MNLTGRQRYVHFKPWFGKARLVLQVEEIHYVEEFCGGVMDYCDRAHWRDATVADLSELAAAQLGVRFEPLPDGDYRLRTS